MNKNAVVLLSGGQDSTTCLLHALKQYGHVTTLSFDYGQRHRAELQAAQQIAKVLGVHNEVIHIKGLVGSSLTDADTTPAKDGGLHNLPNTFLPGRNLVFISLALNQAVHWRTLDGHVADIIVGVCQSDFGGYPDCRAGTISALERALSLGIDSNVTIQTPLMYLTKAQTVNYAFKSNHATAVVEQVLALSVTCYYGKRPGCGECTSCTARLNGFKEAGITDPQLLDLHLQSSQ